MPIRLFLVVVGGAQPDWLRLKNAFRKYSEVVLVRVPASPKAIWEECQRLLPRVLLVDHEFLSEVDLSAASDEKARFWRSNPVIVLSKHESPELVGRLLRMGCMGVLQASAPPRLLRRAIQAVASGEIWVPRKILSQAFHELLVGDNPFKLTSREAEVLACVARGETNQQIAESLCISRETVRWHMRMLYGKLGVHDRRAAASHGVAALVRSLTPATSPSKPNQSEKSSTIPGRAAGARK